MLVQLRADVDGRILDRLEKHLCDARLFNVDEMRLEHTLGRLKALGADLDHSAVRQLEREMQVKAGKEGRQGRVPYGVALYQRGGLL